MNCIFDITTLKRRKGFYAFYTFAELVELGTQTACTCDEAGFYALAGRDENGNKAILIVSYNDDDNTGIRSLSINTGLKNHTFDCRMVNQELSFEPVWLKQSEDGSTLTLPVQRNAILWITAREK